MTRIGIVIPAFDAEPYLAEAVASAQAQVGFELDIVIVDDGSTDGTAAAAEALGPGIRVLRQAHAGAAAARNAGVAAVDAELLALLDADDLWLAHKLAQQVRILEEAPEISLVFGHLVPFVSPELAPEEQARLRCDPTPVPGYLPSTLLMRRAEFDRVGPFDTRLELGEFIDWHARARDLGLGEFLCPEVLARRRLHRTNLGLRRRDARADYVRLLKATLDRRRGRESP